MGEGAVSVGRLVLIVVSVLLSVISLLLSIIAIATPSWQTVFLKEFQTEHMHGLWLDCTLTRRPLQAYSQTSPETHCTYKFENADLYPDSSSTVHGEEEQHKFQEWHKAVLTFFVVAVSCGGTALCFTFCAACVRVSAIVANVLNLFAFLSSLLGLCVFFINSHRTEIRFVHGITMTYEQSKGYSFYLAIFGMLGFMLTFLIGILATVLVFVHDTNQHRLSSSPSTSASASLTKHHRKTFPRETNNNEVSTTTSIAV